MEIMKGMIDLRSDTVTQSAEEMRRAMAWAETGDDVYGDDPTVNKLEALSAELLDKEAALFVPSGTFGNQLALFTWCERGSEVILGEECQIFQHEAGAAAVIAGVQTRPVPAPRIAGVFMAHGIIINPPDAGVFRFVTHYWIGDRELEIILRACREAFQA
jgi:threonine aldolase